jgi:hypothetical protein
MSLLLLLKPHPHRVGRGQRLVIQRGGQEEEIFCDVDVASVDGGPLQLVPSAEALVKASPYFSKRPEAAAEFKEVYKQGLQEGLLLEEMVLLFMMTER